MLHYTLAAHIQVGEACAANNQAEITSHDRRVLGKPGTGFPNRGRGGEAPRQIVRRFVIGLRCRYNRAILTFQIEELMKILAILTYYYPHWTGLTAHAVRVAEGLAARGHEVTVLTTRHIPELVRDEVVNGVRVIRLQPTGRFSRGMIAPAFPYAAAQLIAQHDIVQIHTPLPEAALVALLCRAAGRPLVMTHHGDVVMPAGMFNQFVERAAYSVLRLAGQLADAVTSYSRDYADHSRLLQNFTHKLEYIYPPADIPPPDAQAIADWRAELGLEDRLLIGFAGRWVQEKGFDYLLEALPLVRAAYPNAHLVYAGEQDVVYDDFYTRCLPLIEAQRDHLTFLGLIRDPQKMANFYGMCDLFTLPSRTDMLALVQVEALLAGTPLVTSDIPGARVVVRETGLGRLAPPHDPPALAQTLIEMLRDRQHYQPTQAAVRAVFDTDRSLAQYEELMQRVVRRRATPRGRISHAQRSLFAALPALIGRAPAGHAQAGHTGSAVEQQAPRSSLTDSDRALLETLLRNEADMSFRRRALTLLDYLDLHDGDRVLDCGCGMGAYLLMMSRLRKLDLHGVDGDRARLHWARREHIPAELAEVDIHHLPYADATFDKILMSEVLEHLAEDRHALREVYRVLKPGGVLALSVPHANYPFLWDPINKTIEALGRAPMRGPGPIAGMWSNHWRLYRPADLRDVITGAGFAIAALSEQTHYAFPFIHFIVYSIGKPLIEHNLLPGRLRDSADRFRGERNSGSLLNPINLGVRAFRLFDDRNDQLRGDERTFVNIMVKARKPAGA
jgi:glycosyltransferase involved in cell wall biosynthesis/SAM-dependent methyltransferase